MEHTLRKQGQQTLEAGQWFDVKAYVREHQLPQGTYHIRGGIRVWVLKGKRERGAVGRGERATSLALLSFSYTELLLGAALTSAS